MKTTEIREQIYEFIELYVDTPEPEKLCSSIEDLVDELAESKVKNLALSGVGLQSGQLPYVPKIEQMASDYEAYLKNLNHNFKDILKEKLAFMHGVQKVLIELKGN